MNTDHKTNPFLQPFAQKDSPFLIETIRHKDILNDRETFLKSVSHNRLSVQVVAAGMSHGSPVLITERYAPIENGHAIANEFVHLISSVLSSTASGSVYSDRMINDAIAQSKIIPKEQTEFAQKVLRHGLSAERAGNTISDLSIVQVETPAGPAWRIVDGFTHVGLSAKSFPISDPAPSSQDISGLVAYLTEQVISGKIPSDLFSMAPETDTIADEENKHDQNILAALIPSSSVVGDGADGFVLDIGGDKIVKAWHEMPHGDHRAIVEIISTLRLGQTDAKSFVPMMESYGVVGPFQCAIRGNLTNVPEPLVGFDQDEEYLTEVIALADRLSRHPDDPQHLDMSDDEIEDELAYIAARNEIEDGVTRNANPSDPFLSRSYLDAMIVLHREARKLSIQPEDMAHTDNYGLDHDGNLRLRDLSRFVMKGMSPNIYSGGHIMQDVIAHAATSCGYIKTLTPKKEVAPSLDK